MKITINRQNFLTALRAVSLAISDDETREPQRSVAITAHEDRLELAATNGHWIMRWREPVVEWVDRDGPARFRLRATDVKGAIAWLKARAKTGVVELDMAGTWEADCTTWSALPHETEFPPYEDLMAACERLTVNAPRTTPTMLSGEYAALACRAFKLAGHDARFLFGEAVDPVVVTAQYCPLTAIIMPVRL